MTLSIPKCLQEINSEWILELICLIEHIDCSDVVKIQKFKIQNQTNNEGVLSDICKVFVQFHNCRKKQDIRHDLFIKYIPQKFKSMVTKHRLFEKEITFYR